MADFDTVQPITLLRELPRFHRSLRGYNPDEVDAFLVEISGQLEATRARANRAEHDLVALRTETPAEAGPASYDQLGAIAARVLRDAGDAAKAIVDRAEARAHEVAADADARAEDRHREAGHMAAATRAEIDETLARADRERARLAAEIGEAVSAIRAAATAEAATITNEATDAATLALEAANAGYRRVEGHVRTLTQLHDELVAQLKDLRAALLAPWSKATPAPGGGVPPARPVQVSVPEPAERLLTQDREVAPEPARASAALPTSSVTVPPPSTAETTVELPRILPSPAGRSGTGTPVPPREEPASPPRPVPMAEVPDSPPTEAAETADAADTTSVAEPAEAWNDTAIALPAAPSDATITTTHAVPAESARLTTDATSASGEPSGEGEDKTPLAEDEPFEDPDKTVVVPPPDPTQRLPVHVPADRGPRIDQDTPGGDNPTVVIPVRDAPTEPLQPVRPWRRRGAGKTTTGQGTPQATAPATQPKPAAKPRRVGVATSGKRPGAPSRQPATRRTVTNEEDPTRRAAEPPTPDGTGPGQPPTDAGSRQA